MEKQSLSQILSQRPPSNPSKDQLSAFGSRKPKKLRMNFAAKSSAYSENIVDMLAANEAQSRTEDSGCQSAATRNYAVPLASGENRLFLKTNSRHPQTKAPGTGAALSRQKDLSEARASSVCSGHAQGRQRLLQAEQRTPSEERSVMTEFFAYRKRIKPEIPRTSSNPSKGRQAK